LILYVLGAESHFSQSIAYRYLAYFGDADDWLSLHRFLTWRLYANSLLQALLFQLYLSLYGEGLSLTSMAVSGYQTQPLMLNPLFESTSPSDFWSRRWNRLVHHVLKNGVFKPVLKYHSKTMAVIVTFLASGIFHEWLLWAIFTPTKGQRDPETGECSSSCFQPTYGRAIVFFLWQALLIAIEMTLGRTQVFCVLGNSLPSLLRTFLIICLGIPVAHFFTEPYFRCEFFFPQGAPALPMILRV
jgi:hypothetical protein